LLIDFFLCELITGVDRNFDWRGEWKNLVTLVWWRILVTSPN